MLEFASVKAKNPAKVKDSSLTAVNLKTSGMDSPVGVGRENMDFSWELESSRKGDSQSAWEILIREPFKGCREVYRSGKIAGDNSLFVRLPQLCLEAGRPYNWQVRLWDKAGRAGSFSSQATFVTAPENLVSALRIGGPGPILLRREFQIDSSFPPHSAYIFIITDPHSYANECWQRLSETDSMPGNWLLGGSYVKHRIWVNGHFAGLGSPRQIKDDGASVMQAFDVSGIIDSGPNAIALMSRAEKHGPAILLRMFTADGKKIDIVSDRNWRCLDAGNIYCPVCWEHQNIEQFFKGCAGPGEWPEHIDGRKYPVGWDLPGFNDDDWNEVRECGSPGEFVQAGIRPLDNKIISPEKIVEKAPGHYFFDLGREVVGGVELEFPDPSQNREFEIRLGEECLSPETVRYQMRTGNSYQEIWNAPEIPGKLGHFGLRAFRYGEIIGNGIVPHSQIKVRQIHYPFDDQAAEFFCDSEPLNRIWALCKYSVKATLMDCYQDCPSRERISYEADTYINLLSHFSLDNTPAFARCALEYQLEHPTWPLEWRMMQIPLFWMEYMQNGDTRLLEKYFPRLLADFSFCHELNDGLREEFPYLVIVDWPRNYRDGYEFGSYNTVGNAFMYWDLAILAKMADVLGEERHKENFRRIAANVREAFNRRLFNPELRLYVDHEGSKHASLHANLFALAFGLVPPEHRENCLDFICAKGMACGVYVAQFLLDTLYKYNRHGQALDLLTAPDGNSWMTMLKNGATITTESWDPTQKANMSWAHPWATAPANIITRRLFGIRPAVPGWKRFTFAPQPGFLKWAKLKLPTPRGPIFAEFKVINDQTHLKLNHPPGTTPE